MKILLATPAYGEVVTTAYLESVLATVSHFRKALPDVELDVRTVSILVTTARNLFASIVLNDKSYTHLLFIDSDMGFRPILIERMLRFGEPLVAAVCPKRTLNFDQYHTVAKVVPNPLLARLIAQDYVGHSIIAEKDPISGAEVLSIRDGFARVRGAGTGIMLIKREVIEQIRDRYPDLWVANCGDGYRALGLKGGVLQCFESIRGPDGLFRGEDLSFCQRWTEGCGGQIWSCIDEAIVHYGTERFVGCYQSKMEFAGQAGPSAAPQAAEPARASSVGAVLTRRERRAQKALAGRR